MSYKDMQAKLRLVMRKVGKTEVDDFVDLVHRETEPKIRKSVAKNWFSRDNVEIRGKVAEAFMGFCKRYHIPFGNGDFTSSIAEFERKVEGMPQSSSSGHQPSPDDSGYLVGQYQIIRPYVTSSTTYILEAMEIERHNGRLRHLLVSHNRPEQRFLYTGEAEVEPRYYFVLLSRPHEEFKHARAHRCITFYTDHPRYAPCLSGIMLRGVSGGHGKYAAAIPFVALRMPPAQSLHKMQQVTISNAAAQADALRRVHPDSNLLIGEVREHWYKAVFDICHAIFSDEKFLRGTNNSAKPVRGAAPQNEVLGTPGDPILKTVIDDVLKDIALLKQGRWVEAVQTISDASN
jgi:hypothetical protein